MRRTERHSKVDIQDDDIVLGVIPLYVLHRAAMGRVSGAGIIESLDEHGLSLSARAVTRILRRLQRMGYIVPARDPGCRSNSYRASQRGRVAAKQVREKVRALCA